MTTRTTMATAFTKQIGWCAEASPFTAQLLGVLRDDLEAGGVTAALLDGWPGEPTADAVPLRLAGAFHFLALSSTEPALAQLYPPHPSKLDDLRTTALAVAARQREVLERFIASPPQTNEVGRSAVLLGGFLVVAERTGMPLRTLEIGASAGLNSGWDRYAYRLGSAHWGDPASPVQLAPRWSGPLPPLHVTPRVAARAACDQAPIDLRSETERLRLISYIWPDQADRLARARAAVALCRDDGVIVERADAVPWLEARLARPADGTATVVFHSVMWQYLPAGVQDRVMTLLGTAGAAATTAAPLAWLRFEPTRGSADMELRLTLWPDARTLRLAAGHAHGAAVTWLAEA